MTDSVVCASGVCFSHPRFTGKERDTESGNDYFEARYYSSAMGRFMSPDWSDEPTAVPYAHFSDPQTLNLYSYVQNNPLTFKDESGHMFNGVKDPNWFLETVIMGYYYLSQANAATRSQQKAFTGLLSDFVTSANKCPLCQIGITMAFPEAEFAGCTPAELKVVEELIAEGHTVTRIAAGAGKTADFLVDGVETELKTLQSAGLNTLKNAVQSATKQTSQNIIVDARNVKIAASEVRDQIMRAQGNVGNLSGRVTILTKDGTVKF